MLGISYGELLLILGVTAAVIGPKDLPRIARTAGRLSGRAIGYVQLARGQFDSIMQQTQARQVHKELQDTMAQLEAIRHEIRSISFVNPSPLTRSLMNDPENIPAKSGNKPLNPPQSVVEKRPHPQSKPASDLGNMHSQAITFGKLAESPVIRLPESDKDVEKLDEDSGTPGILPVSAETAGLLPPRKTGDINGSDIVLEAIVEAEVAHNAKQFFAQAENQIKHE